MLDLVPPGLAVEEALPCQLSTKKHTKLWKNLPVLLAI